MSYFETVDKAIDLTVVTDDITGLTYLEPMYKEILRQNDVSLEDEDELYELLMLEVDNRNAKADRMNPVVDYIYALLTEAIDPAMQSAENDLMKNMLEYMKMNDKLKDKEKELNEREEAVEVKENIGNVLPLGINLSKRKK